MSVCISADCPKYLNCAQAINLDSKAQDGVDWASYGSGSSDGDLDFYCGPNGDFKLYIPIYSEGYLKNPETDPDSKFHKLEIKCKEILLLKDELKLAIDLRNNNHILRQLDYIEINGVRFRREDNNASKD